MSRDVPSMAFREFCRNNSEISVVFELENNFVNIEIWNKEKTRILRRFRLDGIDLARFSARTQDIYMDVLV